MKSLISVIALALGIWTLPALATPSHTHPHPSGRGHSKAARVAKAAKLDLRLDASDGAALSDGHGLQRARLQRAEEGANWKDQWSTRPGSGDGAAAVPEPSAVMLFGMGLAVAFQAIPRRSSRAGSADDEGGAPENG